MEFTSEILQVIAKRAWKISWILIAYSIFALFIILNIVFYKELYLIENFQTLDLNTLGVLKFFSQSLLISLAIFGIFFILKTDSDNSIKKSREKVYKKFVDRVKLVFEYRYNFPSKKYTRDIEKLTQYNKIFIKEKEIHIININNLETFFVDGIDTLYVKYHINEKENILFSIWHSGDFVATAIALDKNVLESEEKNINKKFENTLNLQGSKNLDQNKLSIRDNYFWFDIIYDTSEEFLFNNIEQERISRKIAHIVTIGIISSMELLKWKIKE